MSLIYKCKEWRLKHEKRQSENSRLDLHLGERKRERAKKI